MYPQSDIPALLASLMERAPAGFAIGLHVRFLAPAFMFQTYPVEWLEEYSHKGLAMRDPTIAWAMAHRGTIAWQDLKDQDEDNVFGRAKDFGLGYGFAISLERQGSLSAGSFARNDRKFASDEIAEIEERFVQIHDATASTAVLSSQTRDTLRRLSVAFTQP